MPVMMPEWEPPSDWLSITAIDAHTAGEPLRVITGGLPPVPGETILAKRKFAMENLDQIRTALMWEPRGHADMYGCILTEPVTDDGHLGVLFLHNDGFSSMCGHGIIGLVTVALDTGLIEADSDEPVVRIDTPAGRVTATAILQEGRVREVSFRNVPSFLLMGDREIDLPGRGKIRYDVAFGGAFYAFCNAGQLGLQLTPDYYSELIDTGRQIKKAVSAAEQITHPLEEDLSFLYGTIFISEPHHSGNHSRNVCVFADGEVDRSPTGTGVSARAAILHARGELETGEAFRVESILGTCFTGRIAEKTQFGPYEAVIPEVSGSASICGRNELLIDPDDPLKQGFLLR
jgi:trans-L-3-hydroxyproline dehydratase